MKIKLFEFLQEENGGMSCRRLVFLYGSIITIPVALLFGFFNPNEFNTILNSTYWLLGSCIGLTTLSKAVDKAIKK